MKLIKLLCTLSLKFVSLTAKLDEFFLRWEIKMDKFIAKLASKKILVNTKCINELTAQNKELEEIVKTKKW